MREVFFRDAAAQLEEPIAGVQEAMKKLRQALLEEASGEGDLRECGKSIQEMKAKLRELEAILRELSDLRLSAKKAADLAAKGEEEGLVLAHALELE